MTEGPVAHGDARARPVGESGAGPRGPRGTVLVVDDDRDVHAVLRAALEDEGYRVVPAFDGAEGIDLMQRGGFDVVEAKDGNEAWRVLLTRPVAVLVTDADLPGRTGLALVRGIRGGTRGSGGCRSWW